MGKSFRENGPRRTPGGTDDVDTVNERAPLQWQEVHTETVGSVRATVSMATGARGNRLYSFMLGRFISEGKTSKFFQPRDLDSLSQVVEALRQWLAANSGAV